MELVENRIFKVDKFGNVIRTKTKYNSWPLRNGVRIVFFGMYSIPLPRLIYLVYKGLIPKETEVVYKDKDDKNNYYSNLVLQKIA